MSKHNPYDDDDFRAFVLNESKIKTDDMELDEFSPEAVFGDIDEDPEIDFFR